MNAEIKFDEILKDTSKLIELAELGEWDKLISLEKKRELAIKSLFTKQPDIDESVLRDGLQYILQKNKILMQYSHSQRDSLQMEMSKAGHAHKAINQYLAT
jgi:flagellar protein FliT